MERNIYDYIDQIIEENMLPGYVEDINQCFYILPNGEMLGYYGEYGSRYTDHKDILVMDDVEDQKDMCIKYNLVQYVKEYPCAILWEGQTLTNIQKELLESLSVEIQVEK